MRRLLGIALVLASTTAQARTLDDDACAEARNQRALSTMRACAPKLESRREAAAYWMALAEVTLDPEVEDPLGMDVRRDEAIAALGHAARLAPNDPEPLRRRARLADRAGELRVLREVTATLIRLAPDDPEAHAYLAILAIEDGDWSAAEDALHEAAGHGLPVAREDAIRTELDRRQPVWRRHRNLALGALLLLVLAVGVRWRRHRARAHPT